MFGIGMPEMILILAVALIVFGPKKLPELGKSLGRALGEFKRATNDIKESIQVDTGLNDVRDKFKELDKDLKRSLDEAPQTEPPSGKGPESAGSDPLKEVQKAFSKLNPEQSPGDTAAAPEQAPDQDTPAPPQDKKTP
jgi:sec-independent protein translocase protein TatB